MKFKMTKKLNWKGIHFFKDMTSDTIRLTPLAGTNTFSGFFEFSIATLSNLSAYNALFDSYQIKGVQVTFYPVAMPPASWEAAGSAAAPPQGSMQLVLKPEYNDNTPWPNFASSLQTSPKVLAFGQYRRSIYLRPRPRIGVVEDPGQSISNSNWSTAQTPKQTQLWLPTVDNLTKYYGLRFLVHNVPNPSAAGTVASMYVVTKYYVAFKDQK